MDETFEARSRSILSSRQDLDEDTKRRLIEILKNLDISYVIVSHEFDFLSEITDTLYTLHDGQIKIDTAAHLHEHVHAHPYGVQPHKHD